MSEPQIPAGSSAIVVCEKHGLRYNAATHSGCVRCRKEAGETLTAAVAVPPAPRRADGGSRPSSPAALGPALATTVLLVVAAGYGLFHVHTVIHGGLLATWGEVLGALDGDDGATEPTAAEGGDETDAGDGPYADDEGSE